MKFRRRVIRRLRPALIALVAMAAIAPAGAHADALQSKIGDTPADFPGMTAPASAPVKVGDTPADFPGASRAPKYDGPSTVAIVRPERTTVRDVDQALPIVLAGLALLIAVAGTGYVLVRMRTMARAGLGSSH
jgi:hypothetical protein